MTELFILFCLFMTSASYLIYPVILIIVSSVSKDQVHHGNNYFPSTVTLISAYNEEKHILERVNNFLAADYPKDKARLLIISDSSTDRTEQILETIGSTRVEFIRHEGRKGKTSALNLGRKNHNSEIVIFSDSNTSFREDAISQLVQPFSDPEVGLVSGLQIYTSKTDSITPTGLYSKFEFHLKKLESKLGTLAGADGAIYAIRSTLFNQLPQNYINDFYHPIHIKNSGFKAIFQTKAIGYEHEQEIFSNEIHRQIRMTTQSAYIFKHEALKLLKRGHLATLFCYTGHKALRWITVLWLPPLFISNLMLDNYNLLFSLLLAGQIFFYSMCVLGLLFRFTPTNIPLLQLPINFLEINIAMFIGLLKSFTANINITWEVRK